MQKDKKRGLFDVNKQELVDLFKPGPHPEGVTKVILMVVSMAFSPVAMLGALIFYRRGYNRFMDGEFPRLNNLPPIMRVAMILGAIIVWGAMFLITKLMMFLIFPDGAFGAGKKPIYFLAFLMVMAVNFIFTAIIYGWFRKWRGNVIKFIEESKRHGSARFATEIEKSLYRKPEGFYIGKDTFYNKAGHLLTVAGTRAGKSVQLILYNLLMPNLFNGSWVIIDPKAELYAISANQQRRAGKKVVCLNPFQLLGFGNTKYNPLDILKNDWLNLADDVTMMAEAIVPQVTGDNKHFQDRARSFLSTLLLHLITSAPENERHLGTLWSWLRLDPDNWATLVADMALSDDPNVGDIIRAGANEIISMMKHSEKEFGSVMSNAHEATGFIKSPSLRDSLQGSDEFTSEELAAGNVTVYVCIPFDRLQSHNAWLRLVVTSLMRSVVRKPGKDVCFLIDEAASFGFHSEVLTAMSAYAGFGVHIWSIFQDLSQIQKIYRDNWQTFIANSSVRHFFNISDNFSTDYLEKHFGQTSIPTYDEKGEISGATPRPLLTGDELRRQSGETIYTVIDQLAPAQIPKAPYYNTGLDCDPNPYYKPKIDNSTGAAYAAQ
jgi:type IV secretion system protein VirD4